MANYPNRCQHVKINGTQCGSPALRRNRFCFFHKRFQDEQIKLSADRARRGVATFVLPVLEDANSIQIALMQVMRLLVSQQIDMTHPERATRGHAGQAEHGTEHLGAPGRIGAHRAAPQLELPELEVVVTVLNDQIDGTADGEVALRPVVGPSASMDDGVDLLITEVPKVAGSRFHEDGHLLREQVRRRTEILATGRAQLAVSGIGPGHEGVADAPAVERRSCTGPLVDLARQPPRTRPLGHLEAERRHLGRG